MKNYRAYAGTACLCLVILCSGTARGAGDTDIFTGGVLNVPPNVLIIFDTSGSMANDIFTRYASYDPSRTYPELIIPHYDSEKIYYKVGILWLPLEGSMECKLKVLKVCLLWGHSDVTLSGIGCDAARTALGTSGQWLGYLTIKNGSGQEVYTYNCPAENAPASSIRYYQLATGNYLNFKLMPREKIYRPKVDIAKEAILGVLDRISADTVHFGLMRFHGLGTTSSLPEAEKSRGGYLLAKVGADKATLTTAINNIQVWCKTCGANKYTSNPYSSSGPSSSGATPLAETLAEAGLYFAGKQSWANTAGQKEPGYPGLNNDFGVNGVYTSPIDWRCQKNYVIVITDGQPVDDYGDGNGDNIFTRSDYIDGKSIGRFYPSGHRDIDRSGDCAWTCSLLGCLCLCSDCMHWMDDTAKFLYDVDLKNTTALDNQSGKSFNDAAFPPQRVVTYTIGFGAECDKDFLERVSDGNHGHGRTFMADDAESLDDALVGILGDIMEGNSNFVTPVVPVSKLNQIYSGNSVYISLFRPDSGAFWKGNLKKFGYSNSGQILNEDLTVADFSGATEPTSCWGNTAHDGIEVSKGGVGAAMLNAGTRSFKFYTYNESLATPISDLTNDANLFSVDNAYLTTGVLAMGDTATDEDRADTIHFIRGDDTYLPLTGENKRDWVLGDILHSRPAVLRDGTKNVIFVGANDGFLHCFVDEEGATYNTLSDDSVTEAWCFTPWEIVPRLHLMRDTSIHQFYVDGSPTLYTSGLNKFLTFGLRRGGEGYYTLKVGTVNDKGEYVSGGYASPSFAWKIQSNILGNNPTLGESWCEPRVCRLKTGANTSTAAIILAGGYDSDNQDKLTPDAADTAGMAVYAVNASDGTLNTTLKITKANIPTMTHSIVDLVSFDSNGDKYTDKAYAGDMGGQVFAMKQPDNSYTWTGSRIFTAGDGTSATSQMKFFYAPDIAVQGYQYHDGTADNYAINDYVYIGTGDREHPNDGTFVNRFYGIRNRDDGITLGEGNLMDVTVYASAYDTPNKINFLRSSSSLGWFIRLGFEKGSQVRPGEKVVSSPIVFDGVVYFTTYSPSATASGNDKCLESEPGEGFLYALDYLTAQAIRKLHFNTTAAQENGTAPLDETNRRISLGGGMPTPPKLTVTAEGGPVIVTGTRTFQVPFRASLKEYYWMTY